MSISNDGLWIMIRRRDIFDTDSISCNSIIHQDVLPPDSTYEQIKAKVCSWANIENNNTKVIKLRRYDNTLIPYSELLQGSTKDKPIIIEVTNRFQFTPTEPRTLPEGCVEALQLKVKELEKRRCSSNVKKEQWHKEVLFFLGEIVMEKDKEYGNGLLFLWINDDIIPDSESFWTKIHSLNPLYPLMVDSIEHAIPNYTASVIKEVEDEAARLVNQIQFLSQRIDQLTPDSWPT